jgi:protein-arginine kinase
MDYTKLNAPAFGHNESSLIISTRIRVGRNLKAFPLGPGLSREQRVAIEKQVSGALNGL